MIKCMLKLGPETIVVKKCRQLLKLGHVGELVRVIRTGDARKRTGTPERQFDPVVVRAHDHVSIDGNVL